MAQFKARFYDGRSSAARSVTVDLESNEWLIRLDGEQNEHAVVRWELNGIKEVHRVNSCYLVRFGKFPEQALEINDEHLLALLKEKYKDASFLKTDIIGRIRGWKIFTVLTIGVVTLLVSVYLFIIPPVAGFLASKVPQHYEIELGDALLESFISGEQKSEKLTLLVNQFAKGVNFGTSYPIRVTVLKSKQVNAFALPGGNIVVYDAILREMKTPEELAALLAHEVAHIHYRHSLKSLSRNLSGYIFISLLLNDINGITTILVDNANTLNNLSYSRELETEADMKALKTLKQNKLGQKGLVDLFTILSRSELEYLKFISTHPLTRQRIKIARSAASGQKKFEKNKNLEIIWNRINKEL